MVPYFYFSWIKPSEYSTMAHKHDLADLELNAPPNNTELNEPLLDTPDLEQNSRDSPNTSINSQDDLSVSSHSQNKSELQVSMDQMQQQVICVGGIKIAYEDSSCSSSLTVLYPTCRICQMSFSDKGGRLITPCRCKGSLKHVHGTCLRVRELLPSDLVTQLILFSICRYCSH